MNHNGLYWPNGRSLFRRRLATKARLALWLAFAAAVVLMAAASLQVAVVRVGPGAQIVFVDGQVVHVRDGFDRQGFRTQTCS